MKTQLQLMRPRPSAIGWYLRAGYNQHHAIGRLLQAKTGPSGVVIHPGKQIAEIQQGLRAQLMERDIEMVMDTHAVEQGFDGSNSRGTIQDVPWSSSKPSRPRDFDAETTRATARKIADRVQDLGAQSVVAPTHYLRAGTQDRWLPVDRDLVLNLRKELDRRGLQAVLIYYRVCAPAQLLRARSLELSNLVGEVAKLPIDAIWLRLNPFGTSASGPGPIALAGYWSIARAFHAIGVPIVAERVGAVGLGLAAFGAIGGLEGGLTIGESFDVGSLTTPPPSGKGFGVPKRVWMPEFLAYVSYADADRFFQNRQMVTRFGCSSWCCRRNGPQDTLRDPRLHFGVRFAEQIDELSRTPAIHRAGVFMKEHLDPATRNVIQAAKVVESLEPTIARNATWGSTFEQLETTEQSLRYELPPFGVRPEPSRPAELKVISADRES